MSCLLRFSGDTLDIAALLESVPVTPYHFWFKGEPRFKKNPASRLNVSSGASFIVSNADQREFELQVTEATAFLNDHHEWIARLAAHPGMEYATLDFGIELRDVFIHSDILPVPFLKAAVRANVEVELSHYPLRPDKPEDDDKAKNASGPETSRTFQQTDLDACVDLFVRTFSLPPWIHGRGGV